MVNTLSFYSKEHSNSNFCWSSIGSHLCSNWCWGSDYTNWQRQGVLPIHHQEKIHCWWITFHCCCLKRRHCHLTGEKVITVFWTSCMSVFRDVIILSDIFLCFSNWRFYSLNQWCNKVGFVMFWKLCYMLILFLGTLLLCDFATLRWRQSWLSYISWKVQSFGKKKLAYMEPTSLIRLSSCEMVMDGKG